MKTDKSSNKSLFPDKKLKANNRNNPVIDRKKNRTRESHANTLWFDRFFKSLSTINITVAHASIATTKLKEELDSHADTGVVVNNFHDHNRPVNVYSYDTKDGNRSANTVDATVGYKDPQKGQKFMLVMNHLFTLMV